MIEVEGLDDYRKTVKRIIESVSGNLTKGLTTSALLVQGDAKQLAPVDTGNLRGSIKISVDSDVAYIGTNVEYACILGANTIINVKGGNKRIADVQVGDMVLTQTGEYHKVLTCIRRPAKEVPDMVRLTVEYRKGRFHTITTTKEHKFIAFHEGRNKWIMAGDLTLDDKLFSMRKLSHNKGSGMKKTCSHCGLVHTGQGKKYCSNKCKNEAWEIKNPHIGMVRSKQSKETMSKSKREYLEKNPDKHINRILSRMGSLTSAEIKVKEWLDSRGINYEMQYKIGRAYADFFLPDTQEIIEADGAFWHKDQSRDIERDKYILSMMPWVKITHLHFYDKRFSESIDRNPLPNVYYQVCNPHTDSYVNEDVFEMKRIIKIEHFKYSKGLKNDAQKALVYDLSVENVHSYYANGILVSNSFQEFGTSKSRPQPFLKPALDMNRTMIKMVMTSAVRKGSS